MRRYSVFHLPMLSFYSRAAYADVAHNWTGTGFGYLFLLLAFCWIPPMYKAQLGLSAFVRNDAPRFVDQLPEIRVTNGVVTCDAAQPVTIVDPDTREPVAIVDTTGSVSSLDGQKARMLVTRDRVIVRKSDVETRTFDMAQVQRFTVNAAKAREWLGLLERLLIPILYPFALAGSLLFRVLQALVGGLIAGLFAGSMQLTLRYGALLRLAIASATPGIVVGTLLSALGLHIPGWPFLAFALTMGYLFFGVRSAGAETRET
jgi:hypothetical protein